MQIEITRKETRTVQSIQDIPEGWAIDAIDDVECIARCEGCSIPILTSDAYQAWEDSVYTCLKCSDPAATDNPRECVNAGARCVECPHMGKDCDHRSKKRCDKVNCEGYGGNGYCEDSMGCNDQFTRER